MRLLRASALLLAIATIATLAACSDGTAPRSTSVNRQYVLESFNGHALPATTEMLDLPLVIASGSLTLDLTGNSITRTSTQEPTTPAGHGDSSQEDSATYRISGDSIYFGDPKLCGDSCDALRRGSFSDSIVTIFDPSFTLDGGLFGYRIVAN